MPEHESNPAFGEMVHRYTIKEAEEDRILINILEIWEKSLISHNELSPLERTPRKQRQSIWRPSGAEHAKPHKLPESGHRSDKKHSPDNRVMGFYSFRVELRDGSRQLLFAQMNELGRLTLMLPEDY